MTEAREATRQLAERHPERIVEIDVTNHKGVRGLRSILPISIFWGKNKWHPEEQWLLVVYDFDRSSLREYAYKDIHAWRPAVAPDTAAKEEAKARHTDADFGLLPGPDDRGAAIIPDSEAD